MDITISGKHMPITEAIEAHARDKASKLTRYYDRLSKLEIIVDKSDDQRTFEVEFVAHIDGHDHMVANASHTDLYHGLEHAVKKMERQLTDLKEKLRSHRD